MRAGNMYTLCLAGPIMNAIVQSEGFWDCKAKDGCKAGARGEVALQRCVYIEDGEEQPVRGC